MILFITLGVTLAVGIVVRFGIPVLNRYRMAAELRRDWWPRFESEFWDYTSVQGYREAERRG
jgi:hypothetical protein